MKRYREKFANGFEKVTMVGNRCVHAQLSNKEAWAGELHYFPFKIEFASRRDTYALLNSAEIKWRLKEFTGAMLEELVSISFFSFYPPFVCNRLKKHWRIFFKRY